MTAGKRLCFFREARKETHVGEQWKFCGFDVTGGHLPHSAS